MDLQANVLPPDVEVARRQVVIQQLQTTWKALLNETKRYPIFCVSDLHLGDKGPRDNFEHMNDGLRPCEFKLFLDYVCDMKGRLFILGDLFELWQGNVSKVLTARMDLLDRLAKMKAKYILGNHDADLLYFAPPDAQVKLSHPFFEQMVSGYGEQINGKEFYFIHGHQADPYCRGDSPGLGRITAIYSGLREDRHGSPLWNKYRTVEQRSIGRVERFGAFLRRLFGRPNRYKAMNLAFHQLQVSNDVDVLISGHTHYPGQVWSKGFLSIYNTGTWAEQVCSFVTIQQSGEVQVWDWVTGRVVPNSTRLPI